MTSNIDGTKNLPDNPILANLRNLDNLTENTLIPSLIKEDISHSIKAARDALCEGECSPDLLEKTIGKISHLFRSKYIPSVTPDQQRYAKLYIAEIDALADQYTTQEATDAAQDDRNLTARAERLAEYFSERSREEALKTFDSGKQKFRRAKRSLSRFDPETLENSYHLFIAGSEGILSEFSKKAPDLWTTKEITDMSRDLSDNTKEIKEILEKLKKQRHK